MKTRRERLLAVLLMVLCVYALTLSKSISEAITAMLCENNSAETVLAASSHTCSEAYGSYAGWFANSSGHWTKCKTCGKTMRSGSHERKYASDTSCRYCGYSMLATTTSPKPTSTPTSKPIISSKPTSTSHTCSEAVGSYAGWYANSSTHYTKCKTCGKTMRSGAHSKKNASDTSCRYCGYPMGSSSSTVGHTHTIKYGSASNNGWFTNENGHYMKCTGCDATLKYINQNYISSGITEGINEHVLNKNTGKCIYCYCSMKGTATVSEKTYTIATKSSAGGIVVASASIAKVGETITITATPNVGYKFYSWNYSKVADKKSSTTTFVMPTSNVTISATFVKDNGSIGSEKTYTIKTSSSTKGIVTASASTAKAGETITITATPNAGYKFNYWSYNGVADRKSSTTTFTMPKYNVTISANFIKDNNTEHEHVSDGVYYKNYLTHYNKCSIATCKTKMNEDEHKYDLKTKKCVCGKVCPHSKVSEEWYQATTYHYKVCNDCGAERSKNDHKYSLLNTCKTCKYIKGSIPMTNPTDPKDDSKVYKYTLKSKVNDVVIKDVTIPFVLSGTNATVSIPKIISYNGEDYQYSNFTGINYISKEEKDDSIVVTVTTPKSNCEIIVNYEGPIDKSSDKKGFIACTYELRANGVLIKSNKVLAIAGMPDKMSILKQIKYKNEIYEFSSLDGITNYTMIEDGLFYDILFTMPKKNTVVTVSYKKVDGVKEDNKEEVKAYTVSVGVSQPTRYNNYFSATGSGNWKVGDTVTISTSQIGLWGQVEFKGWEISGVSVSNTGSKTVSFTMPESDVSATAIYEMKKQTAKHNVNLTTNKTQFSEQNGQYVEGKPVSIKLPGTSSDKVESVNISGVSDYNLYGKMLTFTMPANDVTVNVIYQ